LFFFKDFRNRHERVFIEDIGDRESVQEITDLSQAPRFITIQKFTSRIKSLDILLTSKKTVKMLCSAFEGIPFTMHPALPGVL